MSDLGDNVALCFKQHAELTRENADLKRIVALLLWRNNNHGALFTGLELATLPRDSELEICKTDSPDGGFSLHCRKATEK